MNSLLHRLSRYPESRFSGQAAAFLLVLAFVSMPGGPAHARQSGDDELEACRTIEEPMQRLACYDRVTGGPLNQQSHTEETGSKETSRGPATTAAAGNPGREIRPENAEAVSGRDIFGLKDRVRREEPSEIGVRILSHQRDPYGKWVFTTEDGQVWKQTDNRRAFLRGEAIEATLKRSAFGTYSVILPNGNSFKVERLR